MLLQHSIIAGVLLHCVQANSATVCCCGELAVATIFVSIEPIGMSASVCSSMDVSEASQQQPDKLHTTHQLLTSELGNTMANLEGEE